MLNVAHAECPSCEGEGIHEDGPHCGYSCDYCGGCFTEAQCQECEGSGSIEILGENDRC